MAFKLIKNKIEVEVFIKYIKRLYKNKEITVYKCNYCNKPYPCIMFHEKEDKPRRVSEQCPF